MLSPTCCGFYSATGMIFMLFVWVMLTAQPFFITGIEDVSLARSNAFGALLTFCATFAISVGLIIRGKNNSSSMEYDSSMDDHNRLNIDLRKNYGEQNYGSVATDSY